MIVLRGRCQMLDHKSKFIEILKIELLDLEQDIKQIIDEYTDKHDHEVISNYVFQENLALGQRELFGIDGFTQDVHGFNLEAVDSVESLVSALKELLSRRVTSNGLPKAIELLVNRKIDKVVQYINH